MVYIFQKKNYSKYIMKYSIKEKLLAAVVMGVIIIFSPQTLQAQTVTIQVNNPETAPEWALLQRQLLDALSTSSEHFYNRYFDERGYLLADLRWGGNDGPDDAIENVLLWPEIYALGGSDRMLEMYKKAYEGHVLQYTYMNRVRYSSHLPWPLGRTSGRDGWTGDLDGRTRCHHPPTRTKTSSFKPA